MNNLTNEWSNFGGYTDFDGDVESFEGTEHSEFLGLSKRGKERRQMKRELRSQGMSRKEARKMALQMVPRSKKKYLALQTKKNNAPEEIQTLQEQGVLSTNPVQASYEINEAINSNIADGTQATGGFGGGSPNQAGVGGGNMMTYALIGAGLIGGYFFIVKPMMNR